MLVCQIGLGLVLFHVVYLSALPVFVDDKKKTRFERSSSGVYSEHDSFGGTDTVAREPWEVNQDEINLKGAAAFDGKTLYQGDIVLDLTTRLLLQGGQFRNKRAVKKLKSSRWPNGEIPYVIDRALGEDTKAEIKKAIRHWKRKTCLNFRHKRDGDKDYVRFINGSGCYSYVGMSGGEQVVSIGNGCQFMGTIVHEIGHLVGFWHEQSRQDRDKYIKILEQNINEDALDQFITMPKRLMDSMHFEYDYFSIMHYGTKFFSKNGKPTIKIRKKGRAIGVRIGQRRGLSWIDIAQVNAMYNCNKIPSDEAKTCFNSDTGDGRDYRGTLNYTGKGITCQPWNERWPHEPKVENDIRHPGREGLGKHNYCRNPKGRRARPWCYTTLKKPSWQYCDIRICNQTLTPGGEDT